MPRVKRKNIVQYVTEKSATGSTDVKASSSSDTRRFSAYLKRPRAKKLNNVKRGGGEGGGMERACSDGGKNVPDEEPV